MCKFTDMNGNEVILTFERNAFSIVARHVFVICRYNDAWLLTKHAKRGLEFPGGKLEGNETIEDAAVREVYEETGGVVKSLTFLGEYLVNDKDRSPFVKAIMYAEIEKVQNKEDYMETKGPALIYGDILMERTKPTYSFNMKDEVLPLALNKIIEDGLIPL